MACRTGASHAPERLSALRPPLDSGWRSKVASPGRKNAPRERDGLFEKGIRLGMRSALLRLLGSSPRGAPRDACVAGTPLRGPIFTVFGYGSRLSARFAGVGRDDDLS